MFFRNMAISTLLFIWFVLAGAGCAGAAERTTIFCAGSSTIYPFSIYVAKYFGSITEYDTPMVVSIGSGGGHSLFSMSDGDDSPDIANSSRQMKASEYERNQKNNIGPVLELPIGYDGITFAHNKHTRKMSLTLEHIFLALAAQVPVGGKLVDNPYTNWKQIDPDLPDREILIYGPSTESGTYDAIKNIVLSGVSRKLAVYPDKYSCIRKDGRYVMSGEDDSKIVNTLIGNNAAIGIFGYSFLESNREILHGIVIDKIEPTQKNIENNLYPLSRLLYLYVKERRVGITPGLSEFIEHMLNEDMIGSKGDLIKLGLIPLAKAQRDQTREIWRARIHMPNPRQSGH